MANIFGVQCQFDAAETLRYNREVQPTAVMGINVDKTEWWRQIREENEDVWSVFRLYPDPRFDNLETPEQSAEAALYGLHDKIGHLLAEGLITHVVDGNEDIQSGHHDLHPLRDRYGAAFIKAARQELGVGTWWGNLFCGHFADETVDLFPLSLQAMEEDNIAHLDNPSAIAFHEYDWPYLDRVFRESGEHWLCGKFLKAMPPILARYPNAKCVITEFGIDSGAAGVPGEHQGWRKTADTIEVAREMLFGGRGLAWYYPLTLQEYLLAVLWFGCGMGGDWRGRGFDIMEGEDDVAVMERVKAFAGWEPPPPPPPNGGDELDVKVIDRDYQERTLEWAKTEYGIAFVRAEVAEGQLVYRLVELQEQSGESSHITKVVDEQGDPLEGEDVAFYWPDAPDPPDPPTPVYATDYHHNFKHGPTNVNGDVGPGFH